MKQEDIQKLENEIKDLIHRLTGEIGELEENSKPITPENAIGRVSRMDAINNKGVLDANIRNRRRKLSKLRIALTNVSKPGFGYCSSCHNPINPKRLMLLPESDKCIRCA